MKRCLILSCSKRKLETSDELSAVDRYDGPAFRVLRKALRELPTNDPKRQFDIYILSAEFGLISAQQIVPIYDRLMTPSRAQELQSKTLECFKQRIVTQSYQEIFMSIGQIYLLALKGFELYVPTTTRVIISKATSGKKLSQLKTWLIGSKTVQSTSPNSSKKRFQKSKKGSVRIQGVTLKMTAEQVIQQAHEALKRDDDNRHVNFRKWYIWVDDKKVAPKWLVSQLSGLSVSDFDANAARRVLRGLGIEVYRNH